MISDQKWFMIFTLQNIHFQWNNMALWVTIFHLFRTCRFWRLVKFHLARWMLAVWGTLKKESNQHWRRKAHIKLPPPVAHTVALTSWRGCITYEAPYKLLCGAVMSLFGKGTGRQQGSFWSKLHMYEHTFMQGYTYSPSSTHPQPHPHSHFTYIFAQINMIQNFGSSLQPYI